MADAVYAYVIPKIGQFLSGNVENFCNVVETVRRIQRDLQSLEASVVEADRKRTNDMVCVESVWTSQVRTLLLDIEDALDSHKMLTGKEDMKELNCLSCLEPMKKGWQVAELTFTLDKLEKRIQHINSRRDSYPSSTSNEGAVLTWIPTASVIDFSGWHDLGDDLIGLDDKVKITDNLLYGEDGRRIISVFGEVGVGKSTFVREIYYTEWIKKIFEFEPCIWLNLRKGARDKEIPYQILAELDRNDTLELGELSVGEVKSHILQRLEGREYLVVLDGVSGRSQWNNIATYLPRGVGCVILIPRCHSREFGGGDSSVSSSISGERDYFSSVHLSGLSSVESYALLCRTVFQSEKVPEEFLQVPKEELFDVTKGNPLGTLLLSGILKCNMTISHWEKVFKQISSYNYVHTLERVLTLSLDDLPRHLRPCFLYLAFLPNSKVFSAEKLCRLWIAEGFVQEENEKIVEEVAECYLQELVFRHLIQVVSKGGGNRIKEVSVSEAVLEFVRSEARKVEFMQRHVNETFPDLSKARRVLVRYDEDRHVNFSNVIPDSSVLRSLFCYFFEEHPRPKSKSIEFDFVKNAKYLRVLEIISPKLSYLPDEIGELINLAYIGLRSTNLKELPSTLRRLIYLQTLDIGGTSVRRVIEGFWYIPRLRNVIGLISVPELICELSNIHKIDAFDFSTWNQNWEMFKFLNGLRSLSLCGIREYHGDSLISLLQILNCLRELKLEGEFLPLKIFELSALSDLESLELKGTLNDQLESEASINAPLDFSKLESVTISDSNVTQQVVWFLARLPQLIYIKMNNCFLENDNQMDLILPQTGFHQLKKLEVLELCVNGSVTSVHCLP